MLRERPRYRRARNSFTPCQKSGVAPSELWSTPGTTCQTFGPSPGVVQRARAVDRDDRVPVGDDREHRHVAASRVGLGVEAVLQQQRDRKPRVVMAADGREAVVRRHQDGARDRPLRGDAHGHRGAQAAPEDDDPLRVDAVAGRDGVVDRQRIGGELALPRLALARAVAAVVERDDRPVPRPSRVGERVRHLFGIAAEVDDRRCRGGGAGCDPAVKTRAVRGRDGVRHGVRGQMRRRRRRLREEDQAVLREPCGGRHADDDGRDDEEPFHRSVPRRGGPIAFGAGYERPNVSFSCWETRTNVVRFDSSRRRRAPT